MFDKKINEICFRLSAQCTAMSFLAQINLKREFGIEISESDREYIEMLGIAIAYVVSGDKKNYRTCYMKSIFKHVRTTEKMLANR